MSINNRLINTGGGGIAAITTAFVTSSSGVIAVDVSDPSNMSELSFISISSVKPIDINLEKQIICVGKQAFFYTIDISDPSNISILGTANSANIQTVGDWSSIKIKNNVAAYMVTDYGNVSTFNITDPTTLSVQTAFSIGSAETAALSIDPDRDRGYIFESNGSRLLFLTNTSDTKLDKIQAGVYNVERRTVYDSDIDRVNEVLYSANTFYSNISAIDVSSNSLTTLSTFSNAGISSPKGIALDVNSQIAYVASNNGVTSINISNPSSLSALSTLTLSSAKKIKLDLANQIAYVLDGTNIKSIDISNPSSMSIIGSFTNSNLSVNSQIALG